ncbi:hypothetical protein CSB45_11940 [candidate division KSB3 bacterium]|uniref:Tetratricopeptide repeat protein n=1 Tax=candidate division KSB3 bacterium TaxID=2044937 RepID=A0A2G6E347_9BACT|nr:MAG: hypothetical protein CSB45_11940 [candidate division KSB3 bacterium]PIE29234.1 MAG: hypothetical protein CSA57_09510 [candidate division KSB3 bacterium]
MTIKAYLQSTGTVLSERKKKNLQKRLDRLLGNVQRGRKDHKLHVELGDLYSALMDTQEAENHYAAAIDFLRQGKLNERDRKQIIVLYGKILELNPNNYEAHTQLAQEYIAVGQKEKASRFLLSSGKKAFENSEYELALHCYQQLIDIGKSHPYVIDRCTEIFLILGRNEEAIENYVQIGDMYAREEKVVEALDYYKKASALDPDSPELSLKVARMYHIMEWTENAAAEMVKIAEYHEQRHDVHEALKYFQRSLLLDAGNERALAGKLRLSGSESADLPEGSEQAEEKLDVPVDTQDLANIHAVETEIVESDSSASAHSGDEHADNRNGMDAFTDAFWSDDAQSADQPETTSEGEIVWQDHLLDLSLEEDFVLKAGLDEQDEEDAQACGSECSGAKSEATQAELDPAEERPGGTNEGQKTQRFEDLEAFDPAMTEKTEKEQPSEERSEDTHVDDLPEAAAAPDEEPGNAFHDTGEAFETESESPEDLEEEKVMSQEQLTAQISSLKSREAAMKREYDRMRRDKKDLQHRLNDVISMYESSRQKADDRDEAHYEMLVKKIQRKKQVLQEHVNTLMEQREQNGRFLAGELKSLGVTKQRLQRNLEYIQEVKARVEQKIQTDLRQTREEVQRLSDHSVMLRAELASKEQSEQYLRTRVQKLQDEKATLEDQFTETISALTEENERLGNQLDELSKEKLKTELALKEDYKTLHLSYERLRGEFTSSVQLKEQELERTAQRLSHFADEYVKLESTLKDIRQERDKLERMLAQETATRERLEENLDKIEDQVDSLEVQGSELLDQLEEELDRQFTLKKSTTEEFQDSLGELEKLLVLQEKEIQSLEVL